MTPKEKALNLWWEFYHRIEHTLSDEYSVHENFITKQCALIAANEAIDQWEYIDIYISNLGGELNTNLKYWYEVKEEIIKL